MADLIEEAHERAIEVLHRSATPFGSRALGLCLGYLQIWARDSAITGLGAVLCGDTHLWRPFWAAVDTLGGHPSLHSLIPLCVAPETDEISSGDWMAMLAVRRQVLSDNVLYPPDSAVRFRAGAPSEYHRGSLGTAEAPDVSAAGAGTSRTGFTTGVSAPSSAACLWRRW